MTTHAMYKYSVTVKTDDLAIAHCLRALAFYAQQTGKKMIAVGHTTEQDWRANEHEVTFHFSDPTYRERFAQEASRILPPRSWSIVRQNNADPASPVR